MGLWQTLSRVLHFLKERKQCEKTIWKEKWIICLHISMKRNTIFRLSQCVYYNTYYFLVIQFCTISLISERPSVLGILTCSSSDYQMHDAVRTWATRNRHTVHFRKVFFRGNEVHVSITFYQTQQMLGMLFQLNALNELWKQKRQGVLCCKPFSFTG